MFSWSKSGADMNGLSKKKVNVEVRKVEPMDAKVTVDNIRSVLSGHEYVSGIDKDSAVKLIGQLYDYLTGRHEGPISLPAPAEFPDDRHRIIWPEGYKVNSRRMSSSSAGSRNEDARDKYSLSKHILSERVVRRAASVTSSMYSTRYVGIIDEEDEPEPPLAIRVRPNVPERPTSTRHDRRDEPRTVRIDENFIRPSPSVEAFIRNDGDQERVHRSHVSNNATPRPRHRAPVPESRKPEPSNFADE